MQFWTQVFTIAHIEAGFFLRFRKLMVAAVAVALIPALYAVIYLTSLWDPSSNTGALAVAIVNLDQGVTYRDNTFNIGNEVVARLKGKRTFGYQDLNDEALARARVRQGNLAFALIIPADFSSNALPGAEAGAGKLVVYTSEGNNFETAQLARHFAGDLGHAVNESLNERRWALVLSGAAGSQRSVDRLRQGGEALRKGSKELTLGATQTAAGARTAAAGARQVDDNVDQLADGMKQLGSGLRTLDARHPPNAELNRLKAGADTLANGHAELTQGFSELQNGSRRLQTSIASFRTETSESLFIPGSVSDGLGQLGDGMGQLESGLQTAAAAQSKLADGAARLSAGVTTLTNGMKTMNAGIHSAATKIPEDAQVDTLARGTQQLMLGTTALADGTQKVKVGAQQLDAGIELLVASLPTEVASLSGSAEGLANSVQPQMEVVAAVQNNGSGFAPNVVPGALWLGAGIAAFLIHARVLPRQAQDFSRPASLLGKLTVPAGVVLAQALLVLVTLVFVLKIHIVHLGALALILCTASLTFLTIVFALSRAFGDAGKAMAMVFLAVQLSSSGGVLPVELSGGLFANISPWLPLTWVVQAIKASMFDAYDGAWLLPWATVAGAGLLVFALSCLIGRWHYVKASMVGAAVNF